jgi:DNA-binding transcriptional ArsR family regulator
MTPPAAARGFQGPASLFAALSAPARLELVARLSREGPRSISALAEDATISRQAVTKHLQVLEEAGLAASRREGRERIFELRPERLTTAHRCLDRIGRQWDDALARLQAHVEQAEGREP